MRLKHIKDITLTVPASTILIFLALCFPMLSVTCNGDDNPVTPPENTHDPLKPTIDSFKATRGTAAIEGNIVYSGEEITLTVAATSHAFPASCGLTEEEVVAGNLLYTFNSVSPDDINRPGLISQSPNPSNVASWRVPELADIDTGEGLLYTLKVTVFDECLSKTSASTFTLRAFANQGAPIINSAAVKTDINSDSPVTKNKNQNGYYEVERGDECKISISATKRTSDSICANHGVPSGNELSYSWSSTFEGIGLTVDDNPFGANFASFDIPVNAGVSATFIVECKITDECVGLESTRSFMFLVVGTPEITSIGGTANGVLLNYDPYFDHYVVLPGDQIVFSATAIVQDSSLCDSKGINPDIMWRWQETSGNTPAIVPVYEPYPENNGKSEFAFVIPAALNGTRYAFKCTVTDQCNGLTDVETRYFLVIVHPAVVLASVKKNDSAISASPTNGRYEISPGDQITVRMTGTAASGSSFCSARGITQSPPLMYTWNDFGDFVVLNYDPLPETGYSDLVFVVPQLTQSFNLDMTCIVTDLCNELEASTVVKFRVVVID